MAFEHCKLMYLQGVELGMVDLKGNFNGKYGNALCATCKARIEDIESICGNVAISIP